MFASKEHARRIDSLEVEVAALRSELDDLDILDLASTHAKIRREVLRLQALKRWDDQRSDAGNGGSGDDLPSTAVPFAP